MELSHMNSTEKLRELLTDRIESCELMLLNHEALNLLPQEIEIYTNRLQVSKLKLKELDYE